MALPFLLLAAQAAGIAMDMSAQRSAYRMARRGQQLEEAQINLRMQQEQVAFEEESLQSLENLREVMASQRALFAAQGRVPGIGSTAAIEQRSLIRFAADERARKLSMGFREHYYKSQTALSRIGLQSYKANQASQNIQKMFNQVNFSGFSGGQGSQFKSPLAGLING